MRWKMKLQSHVAECSFVWREFVTYGSGAAMVMTPARSAVAPSVPSLVYICPANSGNAAAKDERMNAFAAIAEAAIGR